MRKYFLFVIMTVVVLFSSGCSINENRSTNKEPNISSEEFVITDTEEIEGYLQEHINERINPYGLVEISSQTSYDLDSIMEHIIWYKHHNEDNDNVISESISRVVPDYKNDKIFVYLFAEDVNQFYSFIDDFKTFIIDIDIIEFCMITP